MSVSINVYVYVSLYVSIYIYISECIVIMLYVVMCEGECQYVLTPSINTECSHCSPPGALLSQHLHFRPPASWDKLLIPFCESNVLFL